VDDFPNTHMLEIPEPHDAKNEKDFDLKQDLRQLTDVDEKMTFVVIELKKFISRIQQGDLKGKPDQWEGQLKALIKAMRKKEVVRVDVEEPNDPIIKAMRKKEVVRVDVEEPNDPIIKRVRRGERVYIDPEGESDD
jgi:hypothetical protein